MPVVVRLARHLYLQRVEEIKNRLVQDQQEFDQLTTEIHSIKSGKWDHRFKVDSSAVKNSGSMATDLDNNSNVVAKQPESTSIINDIEDNSGINDTKENIATAPEEMGNAQLGEKKYSIENETPDSKLILQENRLKRTSSDAIAQEPHLLKRSRLSELSQEEQVLSIAISDTHTGVADEGFIAEKIVVDTINQEKPTDKGQNNESNPISEIDYNSQIDNQQHTLLNHPIVNDAMETDVQANSPKFMGKEFTKTTKDNDEEQEEPKSLQHMQLPKIIIPKESPSPLKLNQTHSRKFTFYLLICTLFLNVIFSITYIQVKYPDT